jgi:hypothetical protein
VAGRRSSVNTVASLFYYLRWIASAFRSAGTAVVPLLATRAAPHEARPGDLAVVRSGLPSGTWPHGPQGFRSAALEPAREQAGGDRGRHDDGMTTPEPNVPVERSLPEPDDVAEELEAPEEAPDMAVENDSRLGTEDQEG